MMDVALPIKHFDIMIQSNKSHPQYTNLHSRRKSHHHLTTTGDDNDIVVVSLDQQHNNTSSAAGISVSPGTAASIISSTNDEAMTIAMNSPISTRQNMISGAVSVSVGSNNINGDDCLTDLDSTKLHTNDNYRRNLFYHPIYFFNQLKRYCCCYPKVLSIQISRIEASEYRVSIYVAISFISIALLLGCIVFQYRHRKVIYHVIRDPWHHGKAFVFLQHHYYHKPLPHGGTFEHHYYTGSPRFVTIVLPSVVNPKRRLQRLEAIHATWGPSARAIFVVHSVANEFPHGKHLTIDTSSHHQHHSTLKRKRIPMPSDPYCYPQNLLLPSNINFDDGLQRLYHTIRIVYETVNPDFAFFVNDHTYVIPEHLCMYLEKINPDKIHMYHGHALKQDDTTMFNSGAAGYILSRKTIQQLIKNWDNKDPTCFIDPDDKNSSNGNQNIKWLQGNPALVIAKCLDSKVNVTAIDTREKHMYHRFHAFPITRLIKGSIGVDEWYVRKHDNLPTRFVNTVENSSISSSSLSLFDSSYSQLLPGSDCCSENSISFHYVESKECRALYTIRKALLQSQQQQQYSRITNSHKLLQQPRISGSSSSTNTLSDEELKELIIKHWPTTPQDIGAYSRPLPQASTDPNGWSDLIATIRKISNPRNEYEC